MSKAGFVVLALLVGGLIWYQAQSGSADSDVASEDQTDKGVTTSTATGDTNRPPAPNKVPLEVRDDLSAQFMQGYGGGESPPIADITQVSEMLGSYFLLVKTKDSLPMGENREVAAALLGNNPYRTRLLNPDSPWLNEAGELVDRWKTPLYFHPIDSNRVGVRSAGPDKKMWTEDDLTDGPDANPVE